MANILLWSMYVWTVSCCCHLLTKSGLTLCDLMDCSPPGSSVPDISQATILGWVVISFSRGSSWPSSRTLVSCISCLAGKIFVCFFFLYHWATREAFCMCIHTLICHILFIIDYKKLSCHGEQYVLSSIISSYWGDSSYKDKFAPSTLKGMSMFQ